MSNVRDIYHEQNDPQKVIVFDTSDLMQRVLQANLALIDHAEVSDYVF